MALANINTSDFIKGTGVSQTGRVIEITGGGGSGTVNSGTQYRIPYYSTNPTGTVLDAQSAITGLRAVKSDANGLLTHFDTATEPSLAELAHVKGVSSALQTQLNAKLTSANIVGTITNGVTTNAPSEDAVFDALALKANIASPTFTGTPLSTTPAANDNTTKIATTEFVQQEIYGSNSYIANKISLQLFNSY